jgi:steroid 5-alpha reductase family enzyme
MSVEIEELCMKTKFRMHTSISLKTDDSQWLPLCATWGHAKGRSVDRTMWIFTTQELLSLRENLTFGEAHVVHFFSFLCCVVLLCLFVFVMCHVYPIVPMSLSCTFLIALPIQSHQSNQTPSTNCWNFIICNMIVFPLWQQSKC